jgi:hypothetical protein
LSKISAKKRNDLNLTSRKRCIATSVFNRPGRNYNKKKYI